MTAQEVVIPDIGDAEDVEVIELCVGPGDSVEIDGALIVIESDKASMEVPSPFAGTVAEIKVELGDVVNSGHVVAVLEVTREASRESNEEATAVEPPPTMAPAAPKEALPVRPEPPPATAELDGAADGAGVYAGPAVRRLARELGVALGDIRGSGPRGRILKDDVKGFVKAAMAGGGTAVSTALPAMPTIDFSKFGPVEEVPLTRIRKRGAGNLHRSWLNVVHVTQHDEADVTDLDGFRRSLADQAEARGVKLTLLPFIVKACAETLGAFPRFSASLNPTVDGLILKHYRHIGFAVDTDDGLIVPVLRDVDSKGVWALAAEIAELSELARNGRLTPDRLSGGCFTVSSLGRQGGTGFTPIVNAPEVAILGVGRLETKPRWNGAGFEPRAMLPLSLSYDHRALNGVEGGNFVVELTRLLGDIRRLVL